MISITSKVSDNGIGISPEFQKLLFEPFTQENRDDNSERRGSGLGLTIVKEMLDLMDGKISVESAPGKGTTFTIHYTVDCISLSMISTSVQKNMYTNPDDYLQILNKKHILLCEDHPLNQEIAVKTLESKGMIVTPAYNGKIGLEEFSRSAEGFYSAILMDIRMPVMNGYETAKAIRALNRPDASSVPIIVMTADAFEDDKEKCLHSGMNGHIAKPVDPEQLYRMLTVSII